MKDKENLFSTFPEVTKAEWLEKVTKDLKGRSLQELQWQITDDLLVEPFYSGEDLDKKRSTLDAAKTANEWEIGEHFFVKPDQYRSVNQEILNALMGGAEALQLELEVLPTPADLAILLSGIELSYISIHFQLKSATADPLALIKDFIALAAKQSTPTASLSGSFHFNSEVELTPTQISECIALTKDALPLFKIKTISVGASTETITEDLANAIYQGSQFLDVLLEQGHAASAINGYLQFAIDLDCSYFVSIARIRALKLLWANVLKAYQINDAILLCIEGHLAATSQTEDQHDNMIRATTQAMSAVLGGVDRLCILPADTKNGTPTEFTRRIARNIQHLLKMETHFDRVIDPAAGSYYLEELTQKIARGAWARFQQL